MQTLTLESVTSQSPGLLTRLRPWLHVKACTGSLIVLSFIAVGILGPAAAPLDPNKQELTAMLKAPQGIGAAHVLGTDNLGRDILSRVIHGARVSLLVAFAVVFVSGLIGVSLGAVSGYFGGKVDFLIQKLVEVVWAFPPLLLGITIMAFLGQGLFNLILRSWRNVGFPIAGLCGAKPYLCVRENLSWPHSAWARAKDASSSAILFPTWFKRHWSSAPSPWLRPLSRKRA